MCIRDRAWVCPPVYLVSEAIKRIAHTRMMAIVVVPAWRSAPFWTTLFPDGKHAAEGCVSVKLFRPHVVRGRYCQNKIMQGRTAFPFLAAFFRSAGNGYHQTAGNAECPAF